MTAGGSTVNVEGKSRWGLQALELRLREQMNDEGCLEARQSSHSTLICIFLNTFRHAACQNAMSTDLK
jgi:hypothetical protein